MERGRSNGREVLIVLSSGPCLIRFQFDFDSRHPTSNMMAVSGCERNVMLNSKFWFATTVAIIRESTMFPVDAEVRIAGPQ